MQLIKTDKKFRDSDIYKINGCQVFVGVEAGKWHLSISHPLRYPKYDEIKYCRHHLMPKDKTIAMLFPPEEEFINVHQKCFHLWEID